MVKRSFIYAALLFLLSGLTVRAETTAARPFVFLPQWHPQAQFAGYYVALEKGFYKDRGIDLKILRGGPDRPVTDLLEKGIADFCTMFLSTAIQRRSGGMKLVNIGQIMQHSSLMLVAKKSSGISSPRDMNGKRVGLWGADFQIQPRALFQRQGISPIIVPQTTTMNLFLRGGVDVASATWYNEYHILLNSGLSPDELNVFFFHSYGLDFPEDGIYCMEKVLEENPEACCAFVRATIDGWLYAFAHPEEALDIVMKVVNENTLPTDRIHQRWMLGRMYELICPVLPTLASGGPADVPYMQGRKEPSPAPQKGCPMGRLEEEDYNTVVRVLTAAGLIQEVPRYSDFHRKCESDVQR
ncbi:MAG TPA: ABC transporter substrate-binding protein [Syntrophobacteraceae bacterium]|nr:ABC transporter substrate-binding protein [Syntrophobacteraceae bacterium]